MVGDEEDIRWESSACHLWSNTLTTDQPGVRMGVGQLSSERCGKFLSWLLKTGCVESGGRLWGNNYNLVLFLFFNKTFENIE